MNEATKNVAELGAWGVIALLCVQSVVTHVSRGDTVWAVIAFLGLLGSIAAVREHWGHI